MLSEPAYSFEDYEFVESNIPSDGFYDGYDEIDLYYARMRLVNIRKRDHIKAKQKMRHTRHKTLRIALVTTLCSLMFMEILFLDSQISGHQNEIKSLETRIESLSRSNSDAQKRLEDSVNIMSIRDKAFGLGMDYAGEEDVIYYTIDDNEYMRSYIY